MVSSQNHSFEKEISRLKSFGATSVRFAPSPTGTFHVGNLRTAWIAHEFSKLLNKPLWVRFENIDFERSKNEFEKSQLVDMESLGIKNFVCDHQSERLSFYGDLLLRGVAQGVFYPCSCSRKEVEDSLQNLASAPHGASPVYSGCCRDPEKRSRRPKDFLGWRFRNPQDADGKFDFLIAKTSFREDLSCSVDTGNFFPSYLFACAVDDYFSQCDLIIRAWDLENVIDQQRAVMRALDAMAPEVKPSAFPAVFHTALITDNTGHRLEKRTRGVTLKEILFKIQLSELKKLFLTSFSGTAANDFSPAKIWGERKKSLTLTEIGLR